MLNVIAFIIAYLLGSLSSAIIVCKLAKLPDPRSQGSKNPGASNVLRLAGKKHAALTLVGDILKGVIAVLIARILGLHGFMLSMTALLAVVGHMYPIFFRFQGGKGVATAIGSYLGLTPILGVCGVIIWVVLVLLFRYASFASLVTSAIVTISALIFEPIYFIGLLVIFLLILWRHRENIKRLIHGDENKV